VLLKTSGQKCERIYPLKSSGRGSRRKYMRKEERGRGRRTRNKEEEVEEKIEGKEERIRRLED
jgi:hypothetical protein